MKNFATTSIPSSHRTDAKPVATIAAVAMACMLCATLGLAGCTSGSQPTASQAAGSSTAASVVSTVSDSGASAEESAFDSVADHSTSSQAAASATAKHASTEGGDPALMQAIDQDVEAIAEASGMMVGVTVIDLESGTHAGYQESQEFVSASMIKLIIAETFLRQAEAGEFVLNGTYTLQSSDIVGGTGVLQGLGAGSEVTYSELVKEMISSSDNTATNVIIDLVGGMDAVNAEAKRLGLDATELNRYMMDTDATAAGIENYTSADDLALLLQMIYDGTFVSEKSSEFMMEALLEQSDEGGILAGLPAMTAFAHKTGTLGSVRHDGGIVLDDRPFVIVVLCGGSGFSEQGAIDVMGVVAEAVYADIASAL